MKGLVGGRCDWVAGASKACSNVQGEPLPIGPPGPQEGDHTAHTNGIKHRGHTAKQARHMGTAAAGLHDSVFERHTQ